MKALVYYGRENIVLEEVPEPKLDRTEVLIESKAMGICGSDLHAYLGETGRRRAPLIMGHEVAGEVREVGKAVKDIRVGDRVTVQAVAFCGECSHCLRGSSHLCLNRKILGIDMPGCYADYFKVPERMVFKIPDGLSDTYGCLAEPLSVALHGVNRGTPEIFDKVVIIGAGTIGLLTLLSAKLAGAGKVIVLDLDPRRLEVAKRLGADVTVNGKNENALRIINDITGGVGADVTIEAVGNTGTVQEAMGLTRSGGKVVLVGLLQKMIEIDMHRLVSHELNLIGSYVCQHEFKRAVEVLASGRIDVAPIVSLREPFENGADVFKILAAGKQNLLKAVLIRA